MGNFLALRSAQSNLSYQSFIVDSNGILGRRYDPNDATNSTFDSRQLRIINNSILFTSDAWATAALALGEVTVGTNTSYGLVANTLVGKIILGENMTIGDNNEFVTINNTGIKILNGTNTVFSADTSGNLTLTGTVNATAGKIGGTTINADGSLTSANGQFRIDALGNMTASTGQIGNIFIYGGAITSLNGGFNVDSSGNVYARSGEIGGLIASRIETLDFTTKSLYTEEGGFYLNVKHNKTTSTVSSEIGISQLNVGKICYGDTPEQAAIDFTFDSGAKNVIATTRLYAELKGRSGNKYIMDYTITVNTDAVLQNDRTFTVMVSGTSTITTIIPFEVSVTILRGDNKASVTYTQNESREIFGTDVAATFTANDDYRYIFRDEQERDNLFFKMGGNVLPMYGAFTIGSKGSYWSDIYVKKVNGESVAITSDAKVKNEIADITEDFAYQFINKLSPRTYKFKNHNTPRMRTGFIAQEVERVLNSMDLSTEDWAVVEKSLPNEADSENNLYSLSYNDFIAPMVKVIQNLVKKVETLECIINHKSGQ